MRRSVIAGVLGYLAALLVIAYGAAIAAIKGPLDWPSLAQGALICGPVGAYIGVMVGWMNKP
jgi:hypothetical protein